MKLELMAWRGSKGDGLRITKVGFWFLIFLLVVVVGATNTGNNGLFLVLAVMGSAVVVSDVAGRINARGLRVALSAPGEIFANRPSHLTVSLANRSRWLPRWLTVLTVDPVDVAPLSDMPRADPPRRRGKPFLVAYLPRRSESRGQIEIMMRRRGRWRVRYVHATSLFPLGFFRRGRRHRADVEIMVFPETFSPSGARPAQLGRAGNEPTRRRGWGHDVFGLRAFRHGDDPRSIHWKQSARTGDLIFKEHETEENRRLLIVFDNAVGELADAGERRRFERLVSEAATAALDHLDSGYEVSLLSRETDLSFASGQRQRHRILEALALVEPCAESARPLTPATADQPHLRLVMDPKGRGPARKRRGRGSAPTPEPSRSKVAGSKVVAPEEAVA